MSLLIRSALVLAQAFGNHLAFVPPNKTPEKGRYHTDSAYVLQIAPLVFKIHNVLLWCIAAFETVYTLNHYLGPSLLPSLSAHVDTAICPASRSHLLTPLFLTGVCLTILGAFIRVQCFKELGQLFTFDLSILPNHRLVTTGSYSYVRHPSYTGSMLIVAGLALSHMTVGSLLVDCTVLGTLGARLLWAAWWSWTLSVGLSRAVAEDKELQKMFGAEWDAYAKTTRWWFLPGLF